MSRKAKPVRRVGYKRNPCFSCGGEVRQRVTPDGKGAEWRCEACGVVALAFVWDDLGRLHQGFARPDEVKELERTPPPA